MRVFLDTNVLLAASFHPGYCRFLVNQIFADHGAVFAEEGLAEFRRKAVGKFRQARSDVDTMETVLRDLCLIVPMQKEPPKISRDPKDDWVLAAALQADCQCIVSGDKDLWVLKEHQGISIVKPADFQVFLSKRFVSKKKKSL